ncbi:hypothetical protein MAPG_01534 [Magnaporthiopsis poae ATCC 64411]|uniref:Cytochrome b5 heme-binding domain-containing protein n=1 Tax=Magnaporthiopsis poae (strain ATCC 64411 / 73-15) TaxID=644358 RepID=A0A0C4DNY5_MAGP6|nr:hypothetical protein MAPG_01534 [Magnaporthiopsis poae ATCC 64411]
MSAEDVEYSFKDVAAHKDGNDCWMVIHGQVYDVTKYIQDHPGGADVLVEAAGQDASEAFDSAGHSEEASDIMASFRVGKLKGGASRKPAPKQVRVAVRVPAASPGSGGARERSIGPNVAVATVAVVGLAAVIQAARIAPALGEASAVASLGRSLFPWLAFPSPSSPRHAGAPGFLGGFALASAIFAIAGGVAARKVSQIIHFESGLGRYPPRIKATTAGKPEPLLQRGWLDALVYANRSEADILLRRELEAFARRYPKNLRLHYLLDQPPADWAYGTGYVNRDVLAEWMPSPAPDAKVMLCGPPGMVNAAKKLLVELGFEKPGASSKMTDQVFCF